MSFSAQCRSELWQRLFPKRTGTVPKKPYKTVCSNDNPEKEGGRGNRQQTKQQENKANLQYQSFQKRKEKESVLRLEEESYPRNRKRKDSHNISRRLLQRPRPWILSAAIPYDDMVSPTSHGSSPNSTFSTPSCRFFSSDILPIWAWHR